MSRLRSITTQSPAIVISVMALVFSLGTGAGYAATLIKGSQIAPHSIPANRLVNHSVGAAQLQATKITFHKLKLVNGWVSSQSTYSTGNPSYGIRDGVVYLSGSAHQTSGTIAVFGILPKGYRPAHDLYLTVYTLNGTAGTLVIQATGKMTAVSTPGTNATGFTSLAAVSFPVNS
jgi:hypothetical protein